LDVELFGIELNSSVQVEASLRLALDSKRNRRGPLTDQTDIRDGSKSEVEAEIAWPIYIPMPGLPASVECNKRSSRGNTSGHDCDHIIDDPHSWWHPAVEHAEFV